MQTIVASGGTPTDQRLDVFIGKRIAPLVVLVYCAAQSADLLSTWRGTGSESWGWLLFVMWSAPFCVTWHKEKPDYSVQFWGLVMATTIAFIGNATWLNCLQHVALAIAISSQCGVRRFRRLLALCSVLWMPAFGWMLSRIAGEMELAIRFVLMASVDLALLGLFCGRSRLAGVVAMLFLCLSATSLQADTFTYSPVQSKARPFGLGIVDRVALAGSDTQSSVFMKESLPLMQRLIDQNLRERIEVKDRSNPDGLIALNPSALKLSYAADVRAYFVGEGAGYHNSLSFNTSGGGIKEGNPLLIFPDASSPNSYLSSGTGVRTSSEPLFPGDFVQLGSFKSGTQFDFSLISNGASGGTNVFSTNKGLNKDGLDHVVAFAKVKSPFVLIGFEDLWNGGDRDFNDLIFAVYFGEKNVQSLISNSSLYGVPAPEPGLISLIALGAGGWIYRRYRKQEKGRVALK